MAKFNRNELTRKYYLAGCSCLADSQYLFEKSATSNFDVLLYHGLELLFKSFILLKDNSIKNEDLSKLFGHDLLKTYIYCLGLDSQSKVLDVKLKDDVVFLQKYWAKNIIEVRFPDKSSFGMFSKEIFDHINNGIINPMDSLIRSDE